MKGMARTGLGFEAHLFKHGLCQRPAGAPIFLAHLEMIGIGKGERRRGAPGGRFPGCAKIAALALKFLQFAAAIGENGGRRIGPDMAARAVALLGLR